MNKLATIMLVACLSITACGRQKLTNSYQAQTEPTYTTHEAVNTYMVIGLTIFVGLLFIADAHMQEKLDYLQQDKIETVIAYEKLKKDLAGA